MLVDWFVKGGCPAKKVEEIKYLQKMGDRLMGGSTAKNARQQPRTTAESPNGKRIDVRAEWVAAGTYVGKVYISVG